MASATATASPCHLSSPVVSRSLSRLSPFHLSVSSSVHPPCRGKRRYGGATAVRCAAVGAAKEAETKRKSTFQIETLTNWLLKQEQAGVIDAELTIVLSSISMACKQIASLVQRASISNLTGVQGAVNVQGEDQKKLDVVSNEVREFVLCSRKITRNGIVRTLNLVLVLLSETENLSFFF